MKWNFKECFFLILKDSKLWAEHGTCLFCFVYFISSERRRVLGTKQSLYAYWLNEWTNKIIHAPIETFGRTLSMACSGFITKFKVESGIRSQGCISKTSILKNVKLYHSTTENWIKIWNANLYLLFLCYLCHTESLIFNLHFGL